MPDLARDQRDQRDQLAIEDVLSSIRRLVAEDQNAKAQGARGGDSARAASGGAPAAAAAAVPKLVLTDAQRVAESRPLHPAKADATADTESAVETTKVASEASAPGPDDAEAVAAPRDAAEAADEAEAADGSPLWSPEDRLFDFDIGAEADAEAAAAPDIAGAEASADTAQAQVDDVEADLPGMAPETAAPDRAPVSLPGVPLSLLHMENSPFAEPDTPHPDGEEADLSAVVFESETRDADWPDPAADQAVRVLADVRLGVKDGAPAGASDTASAEEADADAFWAAAAALTQPPSAAMRPAPQPPADAQPEISAPDAQPEVPEPAAAAEPAEAHDDAEAKPAPSPDPMLPRFSRRARAEATVAAAAPPEAAEPRLAAPDRPREEAAPDAFAAMPPEAAMPAAPDPDYEDLGEGVRFPEKATLDIDEDILRELIAEVVHEELRGVLGQRITRNVRKMVRREIRIALAAEKFD
jgi:hypothetical protein